MSNLRFFVIALSALLLQGASGWAASSPDGFVGVAWNATPSEARLIMLSRDGVRGKEETPDLLIFTGGTYANQPVLRWELEFDFGHFKRGTVFLPVPPGIAKDGKPYGDHQYNDFFGALSVKYGKSVAPGNPGVAESLWTWNVPDPHSGRSTVRTVLLSYHWDSPQIFKVQYASQLPGDPAIPGVQKAPEVPVPPPFVAPPVKKSDL